MISMHEHSNASYLAAVQFLVEKHPSAVNCTNRMGWLPFHVATFHDANLDIMFYLLCQNPGAMQTRSPMLSVVEMHIDSLLLGDAFSS